MDGQWHGVQLYGQSMCLNAKIIYYLDTSKFVCVFGPNVRVYLFHFWDYFVVVFFSVLLFVLFNSCKSIFGLVTATAVCAISGRWNVTTPWTMYSGNRNCIASIVRWKY